MSISTFIAKLADPDRWMDDLPRQSGRLDRWFGKELVRQQGKPRTPWTPPAPSMDQWPEPRVETKPEQEQMRFRLEVQRRVEQEMARAIAATPRGQERASKFAPLVIAHEIRTKRAVETEARREWRDARMSAPAVDRDRRLEDEMRALTAEVRSERAAETFSPLTELELEVKKGQLKLIALLLDMESARADLKRRRQASGAPEDGGNLTAPENERGIQLEL